MEKITRRGWMGGAWLSYDPVQQRELIWGGEFGQEGANLFAVDVASGFGVAAIPSVA